MSGLTHYFAYGSNMDEKQMEERGVAFVERVHATLEGYALCFNKLSTKYHNTGVANVVSDQHAKTEGVLYTLYEADLGALDRYEGYPTHYTREELMVTLDSGQRTSAMVYIAKLEKVVAGLKPSAEYIQHLLAGRKLLSEEYIKMLQAVATA